MFVGLSATIRNLARISMILPLTMPFALLFLLFHFQLFFRTTSSAATRAPTPRFLNITSISANAQKESVIECWQLAAPFIASAAAGTAGALFAQLGKAGATSFGLLPAEFDGGLHNAPVVQYVAFIAGEAILSLPNSTQTATIKGGRNGLILAADTKNVSTFGHRTVYPSKKDTVAIQIPTAGNEIPLHKVLYAGACKGDEQVR
ncbi:hypothetical protein N7G274_000935 [Stereocaulon virgatum]|uniref:Uncharacterized protein n=1 Tax=Stereocaulon virgatum TaxID=373712 RepID=A0ABR4AME2_9LECA